MFIQNCWRWVLARKKLWRLKQEAYETSITPISDLRMNHLEERGNNTIQKRVEPGISYSSVIVPTIQFYDNCHNSQSDI
jgi:hypothetical protein